MVGQKSFKKRSMIFYLTTSENIKTSKSQTNKGFTRTALLLITLIMMIWNIATGQISTDSQNYRSLVSLPDPCISYYSGSSATSPQAAHCQKCSAGYTLLPLNPNSTICGTLNTTPTSSYCTVDTAVYPTLTTLQSVQFSYNSGAAPLGSQPYCFNCTVYYGSLNTAVYSNCSTCAQYTPAPSNSPLSQLSQVASYFNQSIISQSVGCSLCIPPTDATGATISFSHSLVYKPWLQLYIRQCLLQSSQQSSCNMSSYYNTTLNDCQSCSIRFPNCAACNSSTCLMCPDGFFWNPVVYTQTVGQLQSVGMCLQGSCPLGTCRNMTLGHTQCTTQPKNSISNCNKCKELTSQFTCQDCVPGYALQQATSSCAQMQASTSVNIFVRSGAPYLSTTQADAANYLNHDGSSATNAVYFIAQALYKAKQLLKSYQQVTANIYIGKGSHYFFFCDGSEVYDQTSTLGVDGTNQMLKYCQYDTDSSTGLGMLHRQYASNDNLILNIQALDCLNPNNLGKNSDLQFEMLCVDWNYDERPTIYVTQNNYYFNITGTASFTQLQFRGLNPLVVPSNSSLTLSVIPVQFCNVNVPPTGSDGILKVVSLDIGDNPLGGYSCFDKWYTGSTVPSDTTTNKRCTDAASSGSESSFSGSQQSTLKCGGDPANDKNGFFNMSLDGYNFYHLRRRSLFVLYSFADYQSTRQATPELSITGCDFTYFYGNYDSLITVENNNIQKVNYNHTIIDKPLNKTTYQNIVFYTSNGQDRGVKITIANSIFKYGRFCRGLIYYRTQPFIKYSSGISGGISGLSFTNFTSLYIQNARSDKSASRILIYGSKFYMLNTYTNVTALAITGPTGIKAKLTSSFEDLFYMGTPHKGIVLNIEDFEGPIEILNCDFRQNWHFIPEILITNYTNGDTQSISPFEDKLGTRELQFAICDQIETEDRYFFKDGLNQTTDIDSLYDRFERLSVIYISRSSALFILRDTTFLQNTGTFGGVISINSPNWNKGGTPYFAIQNNFFNQNFAYLSGNAIYIRFTKHSTDVAKICGSGMITNNQFSENIGMKIHSGGAISATCALIDATHRDYLGSSGYLLTSYNYTSYRSGSVKLGDIFDAKYQIQYFLYKLNLQDNVFRNNYAGSKGSAIYLKYINDIRVSNCTFYQNGPVYAYTELQISPVVKLLHKRALTYFDESETCFDEFDHLQKCATPSTYIQWAQIQGALYIEHCQQGLCLDPKYPQYTNITTCDFNNNQVGPVVDYTFSSQLASSIYIMGGYSNYIQKCNIYNHYNLYKDYIQLKCFTMTRYFPSTYFTFAMAPAVKITTSVTNYPDSSPLLLFNTTFYQNKFYNNDNVQVLGITQSQRYKGSLISFNTTYGQGSTQFNSLLYLVNNDFNANRFIGPDSSLVYVGNGQLQVLNSRFQNNGFLSTSQFSNVPSNNKTQIGQFIYGAYNMNWQQENGCILMENSAELPTGIYHEIKQSTFTYNFANKGAVLASTMNGQYLSFLNNVYQWNFARGGGSVLYVRSPLQVSNPDDYQRSTIMFSSDQMTSLFGGSQGTILVAAVQSNLISILMLNSKFIDNYGNDGSSLFLSQMAKILLSQCSFTFKNRPLDLLSLAQQQYQSLYFKSMANYIDIGLLTTLVNPQSTPSSGFIMIKDVLNTDDVMFGTLVQQSSTSSLIKYAQITNCQFSNSTAETGSALLISGSYIYLSSVGLSNCSQTVDGGVIAISSNTILLAQGIAVQYSNSSGSGSAISADLSQLVVYSSSFLNNMAEEKGTIFLSGFSKLNCNKCIFTNNQASGASAIASVNKKLLPNYIILVNTCTFANNLAYGSDLISLTYSNLDVQNSQFNDNQAISGNNGITLVGSTAILNAVTIDNSNVTQSQGKFNSLADIGFLSLSQSSTININNSTTIQNCQGNLAGVLSASSRSSVHIDSGTMIINNYSPYGSVMLLQGAQILNISNSQFQNNNANVAVIKIDQTTKTIIQQSSFSNSSQVYISLLGSSLDVSNTSFTNASNQDAKGMGITCLNCISLRIDSCTFQNLTAQEGGAIYLKSISPASTNMSIIISGSIFKGNKAILGGSIMIEDFQGAISLQGNIFNNSQAILQQQKIYRYNKAQGGAIYFGGCYGGRTHNCNMSLTKYNIFNFNSAGSEGGAISRLLSNVTDDGTTSFVSNKAPYANNIASFPKYIMMSQITSSNSAQAGNRRVLQGAQTPPVVTSGQPFQFQLSIFDQDNNLYTADSSSSAAIYPNIKVVSLQNNIVLAQKGIYNFSNVQVTAYPGTQVTFTINITGIQAFGSQLDMPNTLGSFQIVAGACQLGQYQTESGSCYQCPEGFYSQKSKNQLMSCIMCPVHALCTNGMLIGPKAGFQRTSNTTVDILTCPNPNSCLAATIDQPLGICNKGYEGFLCSKCKSGYQQSSIYECQVCPSTGRSGFKLAIVIIIVAAIIFFLVRSTLQAANSSRPIYGVYLKIMVNHFQLLGPVTLINYNWPHTFYALQIAQQVVSYLPDHVFKFDCLMRSYSTGIKSFYQKLLLYAFLPLIITLFIILFWTVYCLIIRSFYRMKEYLACTTIVMLFLVTPSIIHYSVSILSCIDINGTLKLRADIGIQCFDGEYFGFLFGIALPSFVIWCIMCPLAAFILLLRNKKHITVMENQTVQSKADRFIIQLIRSKYGFLFNGYKLQSFYWEIILFYRKMLMIITVTLLVMVSSQIQILVAFFIISLGTVIHLYKQPYYTPIMNKMEALSLLVISWTLYIGLFYASDGSDDMKISKESSTVLLFIALVIPNAIFYCYWLYYTYVELLKMALEKSKVLFRFLTFGQVTIKSFRKRYCRDLTVYETPERESNTDETPNKVVKIRRDKNSDKKQGAGKNKDRVNQFDGLNVQPISQHDKQQLYATGRELISSSSFDQNLNQNNSVDKYFDNKDIIEDQINDREGHRIAQRSDLSPENVKLEFEYRNNIKQNDRQDENFQYDEDKEDVQHKVSCPTDRQNTKRKVFLFGDSFAINNPYPLASKQESKVHPEESYSANKRSARNQKRYQDSSQDDSSHSSQGNQELNSNHEEDQEDDQSPRLRNIQAKSMPKDTHESQQEQLEGDQILAQDKYNIKDFLSSPAYVRSPKKLHGRYQDEEESADKFINSSDPSRHVMSEAAVNAEQMQLTQPAEKYKKGGGLNSSPAREEFVMKDAIIVKQKQNMPQEGKEGVKGKHDKGNLDKAFKLVNKRKARYEE